MLTGFSTGHDVSIDVVSPINGQTLSMPLVTGFSAEQMTKQITSEPLNQPPLFGELPTGWKGTIDFDRTDSRVDDFINLLENLYWGGQNTINGTITQTIQETNGAVSQYRYDGVALKYGQAGQWKAQDKVSIRLDWLARTRKKIT